MTDDSRWSAPGDGDASGSNGATDTAPLTPMTPAASAPASGYEPPYAAPPPVGRPPAGPSRRWVSVGLVVVLLAVGAAVGGGATALWGKGAAGVSDSGRSAALPFGGFGDDARSGAADRDGDRVGPPSGRSGSGASAGPADVASIAQHVNAGIVDIAVFSDYQNSQGAGTGMVITPGGEVLTNNHVISRATTIRATDVGNGQTYSATVVGYDRAHDVAVLQLSGASGLATVPIGDSSTLKVGASVVGVGNAGGRGGTPSYAAGTVLALEEQITASDPADATSERLTGLIETDAAIVSGDSGGPLVNTAGRVIGIDAAATSGSPFEPSGASRGYAIPINTAMDIARQIESGTASDSVHLGSTAFLGVSVQNSDVNGALGGGGSPGPGALIADVVDGSPAASAGLRPGDIITGVDGHNVGSADALTAVMLGERPGASVRITYLDSGGTEHVTGVRLGSGPAQ